MAMIHFHQFQLDTVNECIWRDGRRIGLTRKAFVIARYLIEHAGRLVTRAELKGAIWPGISVREDHLKVYIRELRKALGDQAGRPVFIETRQGKGYCFIAPVNDEAPPGPTLISPHAQSQPSPRYI